MRSPGCAPLVSKIEAQSHETPEEFPEEVQQLVYATRKEKDDGLKEELEEVKATLPDKTQRAMDLACEQGASNWLTVIPLNDMDFDLNKREFRDAVRRRYDWPIPDVQVEPVLQPITGEELARGTNQAPDARLDVRCRGFWE